MSCLPLRDMSLHWHAAHRRSHVPGAWRSLVCPNWLTRALSKGAPALHPVSLPTQIVIVPTRMSTLLGLYVGQRGNVGPRWDWKRMTQVNTGVPEAGV